jgi:hypothetical protein
MSTEVAALARTYRDYPIELKAAVIAAIEQNGGNVLATSKLFNLPRDTVNYWWQHSERFVELKQTSSLCLADKLEAVAHNYIDSLAVHDLRLVTARDKASVAQIAIQNMQLLRGQPTSITENIERNDLTVVLASALDGVIDVTPEE